jgi:hypothetical protein
MDNILIYRGYGIDEKRDFGRYSQDQTGYVIIKDGCNAAPGAAWFSSIPEAKKGIDALILAKDDSNLWWLLMGNAGLDINGQANSKAITVTMKEVKSTKVIMDDDGKIFLNAYHSFDARPLTPEQALALANMLIYAAKESLRIEEPVKA